VRDRNSLLAVLLACFLGGVAHAADTKQTEETFHRKATAGKEVRVVTYVKHHEDCSQKEPPTITVTSQPAHGHVSTRPGSVKTGPSRLGSVDCTGKRFDGISLWYQPDPGYTGTDQLRFDAFFSNGIVHDTAIIQVLAPGEAPVRP
jgi:hypothetical protein